MGQHRFGKHGKRSPPGQCHSFSKYFAFTVVVAVVVLITIVVEYVPVVDTVVVTVVVDFI